MNHQTKTLVGIIVVAAFLSLLLFAVPFLGLQLSPGEQCEVDAQGNVLFCPHEQQMKQIESTLPLLISLGVVVGAGTYYWMSTKVEVKEKSLQKNTQVLLKMLNDEERKVVNALLENKGKVLQSEVTHLPGMSKVKSHRIIQRLLDRGVLQKEEFGKTNKLKFAPEIQEGLL